MEVILTDEAKANLEEIGDFIARDNPVRASSFVAELSKRALDIGLFPEAYPVVGRHRANSVRRCVHGNYLIFYRIFDNLVEVLHIVHGAINFDPKLY
jgi:toxin ParE1/3/4